MAGSALCTHTLFRTVNPLSAVSGAVIEVTFKLCAQQQLRRLQELNTARHIARTSRLSCWPPRPLWWRCLGTGVTQLQN